MRGGGLAGHLDYADGLGDCRLPVGCQQAPGQLLAPPQQQPHLPQQPLWVGLRLGVKPQLEGVVPVADVALTM
jgi:hypothetical protein